MKNQLPKLNLCCAKDEMRPVMNHVFINDGEVVACDSKVLVIHKLSELFSEEVIKDLPAKTYIPADDWVELTKKFQRLEVSGSYLMVHRTKGAPLAVRLIECDSIGTFPNYRQITPKSFKKVLALNVGLNPELLMSLKSAMTCDKEITLGLNFTGEGNSIRVELNDPKTDEPDFNPEGVIMPMLYKSTL